MEATFLKPVFSVDIDTFSNINWFMQVVDMSKCSNDLISNLYKENLLPNGMPENLEIRIKMYSVDLVEIINDGEETTILRVQTNGNN